MNRSLTIVPAQLSHAFGLRVRASDIREIKLQHPGFHPNVVLAAGVMGTWETSGEAFTALDAGEVVAIGGYSMEGHRVSPWLIASDELQHHRKQLLRHSRAFLDNLLRDHPGRVVGNYVNRDNEPAVAFLQSLGAVIVPTPGRADFDYFFFPHRSPPNV